MTGLPAAATASSASWSSAPFPAPPNATDLLICERRLLARPRACCRLCRLPARLRLEIMRRIRPHLRHGGKGASVIVARVPEQEADAAVLACYAHLGLDVLRGISFRAPGKCLQPGAQHNARVMGDLFETLQRSGDEMFRSVTRLRVAIHPEEVRMINHGREHVAGARHADDVLPGMGKIHRPLPRHHPENVQRE